MCLLQVWRAFEELHAQKKVGLLGISNCYDAETLQARLCKGSLRSPFSLQSDNCSTLCEVVFFGSWYSTGALRGGVREAVRPAEPLLSGQRVRDESIACERFFPVASRICDVTCG